MRVREAKWHEFIKERLKGIGEKSGFEVSESENDMYFTIKYPLFCGDSAEKHTLTYKPDVVWKKGMQYRTIFEIEYLNPKSQSLDKRKYVLGTFILGLIAAYEKSCKNFVLITNREDLCKEVGTSYEFLKKKIFSKDWKDIVMWYCFDRSIDKRYKDPRYLEKDLEKEMKACFKL